MAKYQHILYATDLHQANKKAEIQAIELAQLAGAQLSVVHIVEPIMSYGYTGISNVEIPLLEHAKEELALVAARMQVDKERMHIVRGLPKHAIVKAAIDYRADLIVLGSHGHGGMANLLGSTANAVMHKANCDVIIVRCE